MQSRAEECQTFWFEKIQWVQERLQNILKGTKNRNSQKQVTKLIESIECVINVNRRCFFMIQDIKTIQKPLISEMNKTSYELVVAHLVAEYKQQQDYYRSIKPLFKQERRPTDYVHFLNNNKENPYYGVAQTLRDIFKYDEALNTKQLSFDGLDDEQVYNFKPLKGIRERLTWGMYGN